MRRLALTVLVPLLVPGLAGCWRFGGDDETWAARTQERFADLVIDADPFPAVAWPTDVDSPYERAMAYISLEAADPRADRDADAERASFADSWDDESGGFVQDGIPSLDVSEVVRRALTHGGRTPFRGPGSDSRLADLASDALLSSDETPDVREQLTAARLLAAVAANGAQEDARETAAAALDAYDTTRVCNAPDIESWSTGEVAALVALADLVADPCRTYPITRAAVDRDMTAALDERTASGGVDPGGLATISDASILADVGLADPVLAEEGVDAMLALAADDGLEPDPRYALDLADLADRSRRAVSFGPLMLRALRATVWAGGAIPDDAQPDAGSLLTLADTFALLEGGPDRADLARRVDWDSRAWAPYDRLVVALATAPDRIVAGDLDVLSGLERDLGAAPIALRAADVVGGCPSAARSYAEHHLGLIGRSELGALLRDALPPHLRDLAALHALATRCDLAGGGGDTASLEVATKRRLDSFRGTDGLYGLPGDEPDLELTAISLEAGCHLTGQTPVPRQPLLDLVARREDVGGGSDEAAGGVSLFATLAAAESLAYADGGCAALSGTWAVRPR